MGLVSLQECCPSDLDSAGSKFSFYYTEKVGAVVVSWSSARAFRPFDGFRITPEWLRAHDVWDEYFTGPMTVREAFSAVLVQWHPEVCTMLTECILRELSLQEQVAFACRCANKVSRLWPEPVRTACEEAVDIAGRWASGGSFRTEDLRAAWWAIVKSELESCGPHTLVASLAASRAIYAAFEASTVDVPYSEVDLEEVAWIVSDTTTWVTSAIMEDSMDVQDGEKRCMATWLEIADDLQQMMDTKEVGKRV